MAKKSPEEAARSFNDLRRLFTAKKQEYFALENELKKISSELKYMCNAVSNGSLAGPSEEAVQEIREELGLKSPDSTVKPEIGHVDYKRQALIGSEIAEDAVNHPTHYTSHPSGVECIDITRHFCFSIGNAIKYLWRAGLKKDLNRDERAKEIEDLEKARWYINDRIKQLQNE